MAVMLTMATSAFAWDKPALPASQPLATDGVTEQYIFNPGAEAFLLGDNDYYTRASVSQTRGYRWRVEITDEANPYYAFVDSVERNNQGKETTTLGWKRMFCDSATGIWVDNNTGANNDTWMINFTEGNSFVIGNAAMDGVFGVRPASTNDTRCYFTSAYPDEVLSTEWYATSPEEYARYIAAIPTYNAAVALGEAIEAAKAQYPGIDLSAQQAVYDNPNATVEELNAATEQVKVVVMAEYLKAATWDSPVDATLFIEDPSFETGAMGKWTTAGSGGDCGVKSNDNDTYHCDNADGSYLFNTWGRTPLVVEQNIGVLPSGVYKVTALYASDANQVGMLYANTDTVSIASGVDKKQMMEGTVTAAIATEALKIGMTSSNWFKADNFRLMCYGHDATAFQNYVKEAAPVFDLGAQITESVLESYNLAVEAAAAATSDYESAKAASAAVKEAAVAVEENRAAWEEYMKKLEVAKETLNDPALDFSAQAVLLLADYADMEAPEIIDAKALTTEELKAEVAKLGDMINAAMQCLKDGADFTKYLKNPQMDSATGWEGKPTINEKCGEKYGSGAFDVYQIVEAEVPVGLYEIKMQGFYREFRDDNADKVAWYNVFEATEDARTYKAGCPKPIAWVYMNSNKTPLNCVYDYAREGVYDPDTQTFTCDFYGSGFSVDPYNKYAYPNNMATAAKAFADGAYAKSAYGLVAKTGDKLRLGVKGNLGGSDWAIFDNFSLTFRAKNEAIINILLPEAVASLDLQDKKVGSDVKAQVDEAKAAAASAKSVDDKFNALAACFNLSEAIESSVATFEALNVAIGELETAMGTSEASDEVKAAADALMQEALAGYDGAYTDAQATEAIAKIEDMIKKLAIPAFIGSDDNPVSFTAFIKDAESVNLKVSGDKYGAWTFEKNGGNGPAKSDASEFWTGNASDLKFHVYQEITGLPAGKYGLTVEAANSYNGQAPLGNEGRAYLYAKIAASPVIPSVAIEPQEEEAMMTNVYKVIFTVGEGDPVTVGLKTVNAMDARWFVWKNFQLECYGTDSKQADTPDVITPASAIKNVEFADGVAPVAIYNASGVQTPTLHQGLNIVRMSNGQVRKVIIK